MSFIKEFWEFLRVRKKYWLLPIIIVLVMFGGLIVLTQGSKDIRASIVIDGYPIELTVSTIDERTLKGSMNVFGEQSEFLMIATDQGLLLKSEEEELLLTKHPPSSANDTPITPAKKIETKKQNNYLTLQMDKGLFQVKSLTFRLLFRSNLMTT